MNAETKIEISKNVIDMCAAINKTAKMLNSKEIYDMSLDIIFSCAVLQSKIACSDKKQDLTEILLMSEDLKTKAVFFKRLVDSIAKRKNAGGYDGSLQMY